jgi:hypothetical protein
MDKWSGDLTNENLAVIVDAIWLVTKGMPCVLTETVEDMVEPSFVIPTLWLVQLKPFQVEKKEDYRDGFGGIDIITSKGDYKYQKYDQGEIRLATHVEITEEKISFTFWNKKGKRVVHTYTIHR